MEYILELLKSKVDYDNLEIQKDDDLLTIYRKMYLKSLSNYESSDKSSEIEKFTKILFQ